MLEKKFSLISSEKDKKLLLLFFLISVVIFFSFVYFPPIISQWEGAEIYRDFLPIDKPMLVFSISEDPGTSGPFNTFGYAFLVISRYISDIFGYSLTSIRLPSVIYGIISLYLFYIIIEKWINYKTAALSVFLLATNHYFLIFQHLLLPQMITFLAMMFYINRFQKFILNKNFLNIALLALAFSLCAMNYISARLFAVSLIIFYAFFPEKFSFFKINSYKKIFSIERLRNVFFIILAAIIILIILYPGNFFLFFSKGFIIPSIRAGEYNEYNPDFFSNIKNIFLNASHIVQNYIFNFSAPPSDIMIAATHKLDNIFLIFLSMIGLVIFLFRKKNYNSYLIIFIFSVNLILPLLSNVNFNNAVPYSISVHRLFFLVPFIILFSAIGIIEIYNFIKIKNLKKLIPFLIIFLLCIRSIDVYKENKNFFEFIDAKNVSVPQKPLTNNIQKSGSIKLTRLDEHYNQIYFFKLAKYIKYELTKKNYNFDKLNIIYVEEDIYTPSNYIFGGGDIPRKGYPYYFKMYLSIYLGEHDINIGYLVNRNDLKKTRLQKAFKIIDRYEKGENLKDHYPRNKNQEKILELIIGVVSQIKKIKYFDEKIVAIRQGNTLFKDVYFEQKYHIKGNSRKKPNIILVTKKEDLNNIKKTEKNLNILLNLK